MKRMLVIGLLTITLLSLVVACGESATSTPATSSQVTRIVEVTRIVTVPVTVPVTIPTTPGPTPTVYAALTAVVQKMQTLEAQSNYKPTVGAISYMATQTAGALPKNSSLSSPTLATSGDLKSLVGTVGKDGKFTATVTGVERIFEVEDATNKMTITPTSGAAFVIVYMNVKNEGTVPGSFRVMRLVDNKGQRFNRALTQESLNAEAAISVKIGREVQIQPGLTGKSFIIYEVPTEAAGFKLEFES